MSRYSDEELLALLRRESDASARTRLRDAAPFMPPPPADPPLTHTRLVAETDLVHVRSFRLPREASNGQTFDVGGAPLAFDPVHHTLLVGTRGGFVAELTIPTGDGAFAEYIQGFCEVTEGQTAALFGDGASLAGLLVLGTGGDQYLLGTVSVYYDANNTQRVSHFTRPWDLGSYGHVSDFVSVWDPEKAGFVAGYLAHVPAEWQDRLRGSIVTGQFGVPIVSRTSLGPAAFAMHATSLPSLYTLARPLVYYPGDHPTLGRYPTGVKEPANNLYSSTSASGGLVLIDDTALFIGRHGTGPQTYGIGTDRPELDGTDDHEGGLFCYDPANSNKGPHAYPYRYQVWAYDLHDFAAVAAGQKQPWEVVPYAVWPLVFPTLEREVRGIGGAAFDPLTRTLYVSQLSADQDGYAYRALIHVFKVTND